MSTSARKRLMRDFKRLQKDAPQGIQAAPLDNNVMVWQAVIFGPDDTPWEGGTFKLLLEFTEEYPNKPPAVRFLSKIFHPNVYGDGKICLDILQNQWSAIYDIASILTSIQSLLSDPNPASPANSEASTLFENDRREYHRRVRCAVEASWLDDDDTDMKEDGRKLAAEASSSTAAMTVGSGTAVEVATDTSNGSGASASAGAATGVVGDSSSSSAAPTVFSAAAASAFGSDA